MNTTPPTPLNRMRLQLSIRSLLIAVTVFAVLVAIATGPLAEHVQNVKVAKRIEELGGSVKMVPRSPCGWERFLERFGLEDRLNRITWISIQRPKNTTLTLEDANAIAALGQLTRIDLTYAGVTDDVLKELARCSTLQSVDVSCQPLLTDDGIRHFNSHPNLRTLRIFGTACRNNAYREVLSTLPNLEQDVEDVIRSRIAQALSGGVFYCGVGRPKKHDSIDMSVRLATPVQEVIRQVHLLNGINCRIGVIAVESRHMNATVATALRELKDLTSLELICDATPAPNMLTLVASIPQLERFEYRGMTLSGNLEALAQLENLHELHLESNNIRDSDLAALSKLPNLKVLRLPQAPLTSRALSVLMDIGCQLDVLELPASFRDMKDHIITSGVADDVQFRGRSPAAAATGFYRRTAMLPSGLDRKPGFDFNYLRSKACKQEHIRYIDKLTTNCKFPRPQDSPKRPEDYILDLRRELLTEIAAIQFSSSSTAAIKTK